MQDLADSGLRSTPRLRFPASPASCCDPHFPTGCSPGRAPPVVTYTSVSTSGSAAANDTPNRYRQGNNGCKRLESYGDGRAVKEQCSGSPWSWHGECWGASFTSPLLQPSGYLTLCKDVHRTVYRYVHIHCAVWLSKHRLKWEGAGALPSLSGQMRKARLKTGEVTCLNSLASPGLRVVPLVPRLCHLPTATRSVIGASGKAKPRTRRRTRLPGCGISMLLWICFHDRC